MAKPMPAQGDPESQVCRHCGEPKLIVRGKTLMCEICDAPVINGITIRPTWKGPTP
jgi:hypothetical protein